MLMPILILTMLGILLGLIIVFADKSFYVPEDLRVKKIMEFLPLANCGACGFAGCAAFADALVKGTAKPNACIPGGADVTAKLAGLLGEDVIAGISYTAKVRCKGGIAEAKERVIYDGITDCFAAVLVANGSKECEYGCLGYGSCVSACPFGAIKVNSNGVAFVLDDKCVGCGACVAACPRKLIELTPEKQKIFVACNNHDKGAKVKKYCSVGCTGCSLCVKAVAVSNSIEMDNFLPKLNYETAEDFVVPLHKCPSHCFTDLAKGRPTVHIDTKCVGCGACVEICPMKGAIEGEKSQRHSINKKLCVGCGRCIPVCKVKAIGIWGALAYGENNRSSQKITSIS